MDLHNEMIKSLSTAARNITKYTIVNLSSTPFIRKKSFFSERD